MNHSQSKYNKTYNYCLFLFYEFKKIHINYLYCFTYSAFHSATSRKQLKITWILFCIQLNTKWTFVKIKRNKVLSDFLILCWVYRIRIRWGKVCSRVDTLVCMIVESWHQLKWVHFDCFSCDIISRWHKISRCDQIDGCGDRFQRELETTSNFFLADFAHRTNLLECAWHTFLSACYI